jgi:hypothetical protein
MIRAIKRRILKYCLHVIYYIFNSKITFSTFFRVKVLRAHRQYKIINLNIELPAKKVIILALFPRRALLPSIKRFIDFAISQDFQVLVVLNESKDSQLFQNFFKTIEKNICVLTRENIGRDFGAYQCAVSYLTSIGAMDNIEKLGFFNDSIYYSNKFDWFVRLNNLDSNISSLYINHEQEPSHFQSMAFFCDRTVIISNSFKRFWSEYYPTEIRTRVIKNGELRLTKELAREGFIFHDLAMHLLGMELKPLTVVEKNTLLMFSLDSSPQKNLLTKILTQPNFPVTLETDLPDSMVRSLVNLVTTSKNVSHAMGHYFTRNYSFPLKMDLVKFGTHGYLDITDLLLSMKISHSEVHELIALLSKTGSYYSVSGRDKILRRFNIV